MTRPAPEPDASRLPSRFPLVLTDLQQLLPSAACLTPYSRPLPDPDLRQFSIFFAYLPPSRSLFSRPDPPELSCPPDHHSTSSPPSFLILPPLQDASGSLIPPVLPRSVHLPPQQLAGQVKRSGSEFTNTRPVSVRCFISPSLTYNIPLLWFRMTANGLPTLKSELPLGVGEFEGAVEVGKGDGGCGSHAREE